MPYRPLNTRDVDLDVRHTAEEVYSRPLRRVSQQRGGVSRVTGPMPERLAVVFGNHQDMRAERREIRAEGVNKPQRVCARL